MSGRNEIEEETTIPAIVLGCLQVGYLRMIVGYEYGFLEGGVEWDIPMDLIPVQLRMPNSKLRLIYDRSQDKIIAIEPFPIEFS
ncbi:MAG: hypothetical protein SW833_22540 [Cyanobacteriota bacterium]|nr:hypothetical protein [Cyanobacteriota bacterium]